VPDVPPPDDASARRGDPSPSSAPLARRAPSLPAEHLAARSLAGSVSAAPEEGTELVVGRDPGEGQLGLGVDDPSVSRRHLVLRREGGLWWLHNLGRRAVRLPSGVLLPAGDPVPLGGGYTAAFVEGTRRRSHLVELYVSEGGRTAATRPDVETVAPRAWPLTPDEHLAMVVLGQRYLRHEPRPRPLSWQEAAVELEELDPAAGWTRKRVERKVARVRQRLARAGVPGLLAEDIEGPLGNDLNHNLIRELVDSTTVVPSDLAEAEARLDP
jgi:hypothetical protein